MNKENSKRLSLILLVGILNSCASEVSRVVLTTESPRIYETKAQIKTEKENNTVKIQVALLPFKAIRMEITGTLGVSVATILMTPRQIKIAIHTQKTFIEGPFDQKTLYPVFKQNISPRAIWKIIHEQSPEDKNWSCQLNETSKPLICQSKDGMEINWTYESVNHKRIDLKADKFEMNWVFKDVLQMPQYQNETFVLNKPEGYKEIIIK